MGLDRAIQVYNKASNNPFLYLKTHPKQMVVISSASSFKIWHDSSNGQLLIRMTVVPLRDSIRYGVLFSNKR